MTYSQVAGAILWGGFAAVSFLWLLQWDIAQLSLRHFRGRNLRAALRVVATAFTLALVGAWNFALIPVAIVSFIVVRNAMLWRVGGCHGH
jgi:hypothetical protein